jgi:hypothetical protein
MPLEAVSGLREESFGGAGVIKVDYDPWEDINLWVKGA